MTDGFAFSKLAEIKTDGWNGALTRLPRSASYKPMRGDKQCRPIWKNG